MEEPIKRKEFSLRKVHEAVAEELMRLDVSLRLEAVVREDSNPVRKLIFERIIDSGLEYLILTHFCIARNILSRETLMELIKEKAPARREKIEFMLDELENRFIFESPIKEFQK